MTVTYLPATEQIHDEAIRANFEYIESHAAFKDVPDGYWEDTVPQLLAIPNGGGVVAITGGDGSTGKVIVTPTLTGRWEVFGQLLVQANSANWTPIISQIREEVSAVYVATAFWTHHTAVSTWQTAVVHRVLTLNAGQTYAFRIYAQGPSAFGGNAYTDRSETNLTVRRLAS